VRDAPPACRLSAEQLEEIQRALLPGRNGGSKERRSSRRRSYPTIQLLASYDGMCPPSRTDFSPVRCYDISQGGVSFLWPGEPPFRHVVIGLDSTLSRVWLKARVVRHLPIAGLKGEFLVCCQFLGRVECCW
jgi:hypothetical protein